MLRTAARWSGAGRTSLGRSALRRTTLQAAESLAYVAQLLPEQSEIAPQFGYLAGGRCWSRSPRRELGGPRNQVRRLALVALHQAVLSELADCPPGDRDRDVVFLLDGGQGREPSRLVELASGDALSKIVADLPVRGFATPLDHLHPMRRRLCPSVPKCSERGHRSVHRGP